MGGEPGECAGADADFGAAQPVAVKFYEMLDQNRQRVAALA